MIIEEYLTAIKTQLATSGSVDEFRIVEEWAQVDEGYIRVRIDLINGDFLELAEYFVVLEGECITRRYRYQWMDAERRRLRKRWDNVEHYPDLPNFPHHIHLANGEVIAGHRLSILDVLALLEDEVSGS